MNISEMLSRNAFLFPDKTALVEVLPSKVLRKEITWREFNERVDKFANALMKMGIRKGDKVAHLMMNSINWLVAYFGIVRIGALVIPLNYRFISRQIKYCLEIGEAKAIILGEEFTERIEAIRPELLLVKNYIFVGNNLPTDMESFEDLIDKAPADPVHVGLNSDDECAIYFTSGTTGDPKAILFTYGNMESTAIHETYAHRESIKDNFLLMQPLYHAGGKMHWFGSLIVGAKTTIIVGDKITPKLIFDVIHSEKATITMLLVPWIQDMILALDNEELCLSNYDLTSWRLMHSGSQPISPSLIRHWKGYFPNVQYETNYGLTESTGPCIHMGLDNLRKLGSIGIPTLDVDARVVNEKDEFISLGETGELILRGNNIMKGYYKDQKRTEETLKNDWLHTGDLVRMDKDGYIYFVDRKKDIIISGGENIYPTEIEDILMTMPKISCAAVISVPDQRLCEIAVAIIETKPNTVLTVEEVRAFFEPRLPKYMWPRGVIFDNIPRNPTGKVEKPKLRAKYADYKP